MLGINNNNIRKKLLQDRKLTLTKAIDICRSSEKTKQQVKNISADNATNEAEINAEVERGGVSEWIGEMGDLTKSDADIAVQPTSEKRSYVQHLEVVAISAAEKTILRKSACEKRKSSERNQCGLCQEMNLPIREIQYRLWNWSQAKTIPL